MKKPWRRSNHYEALGQMLVINQRLDKLTAIRASFIDRGMLPPDRLAPPPAIMDPDQEGPIDSPRVVAHMTLAQTREPAYPRVLSELVQHIGVEGLPILVEHFLRDQLDNPNTMINLSYLSPISVFHSAVAIFYAPSDTAGIHGMSRERIRCTPS